jgi:integral membrane protein
VLLLFFAMPLKYLAGEPLAVRVVGSLHGALFIWLGWLVLQGIRQRGRSFAWGARIGVASILPFGTFFLDRRLHGEDEAWRLEHEAR